MDAENALSTCGGLENVVPIAAPRSNTRTDAGAPDRSGAAAAGLRRGAEDVIPVRSADPVAGVVVLEVMAHVQLAQLAPQARRRPVMVRVVMEHVVGQVARDEPAEDRQAPR